MIGPLKDIISRVPRYYLARSGWVKPGTPFNLTFSITNMCQSRCKTCRIWDLYNKNPEKRAEELTVYEIERIFRSMGRIPIFNLSGGEPFLRGDIVEIIDLACKYLKPMIIHIPTNAISVKLAEKKTLEILNIVKRRNPSIQLTVKPSLDHIGEKHDEIRGVPDNFNKVMELFKRLRAFQKRYPNLHAELGTVISVWNVNDIKEIAGFVSRLGADSYRNEIAEKRSEMFNEEEDITPEAEEYKRAIQVFVQEIRKNMKDRRFFQRSTNAFRLQYYKLVSSIMMEHRQVIPCYAGISNAHMSPYGDIWPCCTLGYEMSMGNVRECHYDFRTVWNSERAKRIREYIKNGRCHCPLANQAYSNILMNGASLLGVIREMV
jgi:MoaA/NifB/PqqE/SkfB family radical SAM enzyme